MYDYTLYMTYKYNDANHIFRSNILYKHCIWFTIFLYKNTKYTFFGISKLRINNSNSKQLYYNMTILYDIYILYICVYIFVR